MKSLVCICNVKYETPSEVEGCFQKHLQNDDDRDSDNDLKCDLKPLIIDIPREYIEPDVPFNVPEPKKEQKFDLDGFEVSFKSDDDNLKLKNNNACDKCSYVGKTKNLLWRHKMNIHAFKRFSCPQCVKLFGLESSLKQHLLIVHTVGRQFACRHCPKTFKSKKSVNFHIQRNHPTHVFKCSKCNFFLKDKENFEKHVCSYKSIQCDKCPRILATKLGLKYHLKSHEPSPNPILNGNFGNDTKTTISYVPVGPIVSSSSPFNTFKQNFGLKKPRNSPQRLKFEPKDDTKVNEISYNVKCSVEVVPTVPRHEEAIKIYICSKCNKSFKCRASFLKHKEAVHSKTIFECKICDKVLSSQQAEDNHRQAHSENQSIFVCDRCDSKLTSKRKLFRHFRDDHKVKFVRKAAPKNLVLYECSKCRFTSEKKISVVRHLRTHHNQLQPKEDLSLTLERKRRSLAIMTFYHLLVNCKEAWKNL